MKPSLIISSSKILTKVTNIHPCEQKQSSKRSSNQTYLHLLKASYETKSLNDSDQFYKNLLRPKKCLKIVVLGSSLLLGLQLVLGLYVFGSYINLNYSIKHAFQLYFTCGCDIAEEGSCDTLQLEKYFQMKGAKFFEKLDVNISLNSYSFHVDHVTTTSCCAHFTITENIKSDNISSAGGSSFLITAISDHHLVTCTISDHFNGQYTVTCPLHDSCTNITAEVFYVNFGAFYERRYTSSLVFWTQKLCMTRAFQESDRNYQSSLPSNDYTGWYRSNTSEQWSWVTVTNNVLSTTSTNQLRDCLEKVSEPVYLFGDSHLRYVFYTLLDLFNDLPAEMQKTKIRNSVTYKNFHFDYSAHLTYNGNPEFPPFFPRAKNLLYQLSNMSSESQASFSSTNKRQIFVFSVGVWDIAWQNAEYLIDHVIPQLTDFMIKLHRLAQMHGGKVIYLAAPSSFRELAKKEDGRNNAKIAAYNKLVIDVVKPHGVTVVNFHAMTVNRYREANEDGHHFKPFPNSAGEQVARKVLNVLCKPHKFNM